MAFDVLKQTLGRRHLMEKQQELLEESPLYGEQVRLTNLLGSLRSQQAKTSAAQAGMFGAQEDLAEFQLGEAIRMRDRDVEDELQVSEFANILQTYDVNKDVLDEPDEKQLGEADKKLKKISGDRFKTLYFARKQVTPRMKQALQRKDPGFYNMLFPAEKVKTTGRDYDAERELAKYEHGLDITKMNHAWSIRQKEIEAMGVRDMNQLLQKGQNMLDRINATGDANIILAAYKAELGVWGDAMKKRNLDVDDLETLWLNQESLVNDMADQLDRNGWFTDSEEEKKFRSEAMKFIDNRDSDGLLDYLGRYKPKAPPEKPTIPKGKPTELDFTEQGYKQAYAKMSDEQIVIALQDSPKDNLLIAEARKRGLLQEYTKEQEELIKQNMKAYGKTREEIITALKAVGKL